MWAKLLACRAMPSVKLWQAENVLDRAIQIKFGFAAEEAVDRALGKCEYSKTYSVIMQAMSTFNPDLLKEFDKKQVEDMEIEFNNVNDMLEEEPADLERSPSPHAGFT